jgi:DNA mismatch repair protein MutL
LLQVIHDIQDTEQTLQNQWQETMTLCLARQMAIPMGKALSDIEMRDLVNRLIATNTSRHLPNGQTILSIINNDELQKRF